MGSIGPLQLILFLAVAILVFGGRGRISGIMGDMAKGITSFRKGLKDEDDDETQRTVSKEDLVDVTPEKDKAKSSS
jgi:sec-independent protein translocase protein TatA